MPMQGYKWGDHNTTPPKPDNNGSRKPAARRSPNKKKRTKKTAGSGSSRSKTGHSKSDGKARWTDLELQVVKENLADISGGMISEEVVAQLSGRSLRGIQQKAQALLLAAAAGASKSTSNQSPELAGEGKKKPNSSSSKRKCDHWTAQELQIVSQNLSDIGCTTTPPSILAQLPGRSQNAIWQAAWKMKKKASSPSSGKAKKGRGKRGPKKGQAVVRWSTKELKIVSRHLNNIQSEHCNWPEIMTLLPGRSQRSIQNKARAFRRSDILEYSDCESDSEEEDHGDDDDDESHDGDMKQPAIEIDEKFAVTLGGRRTNNSAQRDFFMPSSELKPAVPRVSIGSAADEGDPTDRIALPSPPPAAAVSSNHGLGSSSAMAVKEQSSSMEAKLPEDRGLGSSTAMAVKESSSFMEAKLPVDATADVEYDI